MSEKKKRAKGPFLRKIRYENSSTVIFVLRPSRTFYPLKLLVWTLNYVHKQWLPTKVNIEDFLSLLNAEKEISCIFFLKGKNLTKTVKNTPN
jgi:hypothetical protein